jgi:ubiquinone biosynthesis protein
VIEKYSTNRVLTEERVKGRKTSDLADVPKRTRTVISRRIARFVLEPAFEHGMFYADPHPGNLLMENDGSLSVIDFGKIGRLTPTARRRAANLFLAIGRSDGPRVADSLIEIAAPEHPIDRASLAREIDRMLELYVDVSLEKNHCAKKKSSMKPNGTRMASVRQKARRGMCNPPLGRNHPAITAMGKTNNKRLTV